MSEVKKLIAEARGYQGQDEYGLVDLAHRLADALEALDSAPPVPSDSDREAWADDDLYGVIDRAMQRSWTDAAGYDYAPSEITAAVQTWMDEQGFRRSPEPQQVSTIEELDALPHRTYVRGCDGYGHVKHLDHWVLTAGIGSQHDASGIELPATVLWAPDAEGRQ